MESLIREGKAFGIVGPTENAAAGTSITAVPDWNGDGIGELVIGAPGSDTVYVLFGGAHQGEIDLADFGAHQLGVRLLGEPYDFSGSSVANVGDINADGTADIAIGGPFLSTDSLAVAGAVYVLWGQKYLGDVLLSDLSALGIGGRVLGGENEDYVGWRLYDAGDVNGDGFDDVLFSTGLQGAGRTSVRFGAEVLSDLTVQMIDAGLEGFSSNAGLHARVAIGDVNGDGFADYAAFDADIAAYTAVIFGKQSTGFVSLSDVQLGQGGYIVDLAPDLQGSAIGFDAKSDGDFDGDGFRDIVFSSAVVVDSALRVALIRRGLLGAEMSFGALRDDGRVVSFSGAGMGFGAAVQYVPDLNGDKCDEVLIGDLVTDGGSVWLVPGNAGAGTIDVSTLTTESGGGARFYSENAGGGLGRSLYAYDIDGDGLAELIFGLPAASPKGRAEAGRVVVVDGAAAGTLLP